MHINNISAENWEFFYIPPILLFSAPLLESLLECCPDLYTYHGATR